MAYIPKSDIEQNQLASMNQNLLSSGNPTQAPTAGEGQAGTQNTAGSSAQAMASGGSGGLGNQYTNFQDIINANQGATESTAANLGSTLGISDAESALSDAYGKVGEASQAGISNVDDEYLNKYLSSPFEVDQEKYGNLASIIGGSGYRGPDDPTNYYSQANQKLLKAQENASLIDDPYGLQTLLQQNPTGNTTAGGTALDASLLYGNEAARAKLGEAKTKAEGLTGQYNTSLTQGKSAIDAAKAQQASISEAAKSKVLGAQQGIRTAAEQRIGEKLTTDQAKFAEAKDAANRGDFSKLSEILGPGAVDQLQQLYGTLDPGTAGDLGSYIQTPESTATGYATGDVLTPEEQAKYQEFGNILNSSDSFIQAARNPSGIGFDQDTAKERLQGLFNTQEAARVKQREILAKAQADKDAAAKADADRIKLEQDNAAEQERLRLAAAENARLAEEARARGDAEAAAKAEKDRQLSEEQSRILKQEADRLLWEEQQRKLQADYEQKRRDEAAAAEAKRIADQNPLYNDPNRPVVPPKSGINDETEEQKRFDAMDARDAYDFESGQALLNNLGLHPDPQYVGTTGYFNPWWDPALKTYTINGPDPSEGVNATNEGHGMAYIYTRDGGWQQRGGTAMNRDQVIASQLADNQAQAKIYAQYNLPFTPKTAQQIGALYDQRVAEANQIWQNAGMPMPTSIVPWTAPVAAPKAPPVYYEDN
jgi:hypothetical protein